MLMPPPLSAPGPVDSARLVASPNNILPPREVEMRNDQPTTHEFVPATAAAQPPKVVLVDIMWKIQSC